MDLKHRFPAISYLEARAKRRMPRFAWEFFDSGTGDDEAARRNTQAFAGVTLTPRFMHGEFDPTVSTTLFGEQYEVPFGVAPGRPRPNAMLDLPRGDVREQPN